MSRKLNSRDFKAGFRQAVEKVLGALRCGATPEDIEVWQHDDLPAWLDGPGREIPRITPGAGSPMTYMHPPGQKAPRRPVDASSDETGKSPVRPANASPRGG